MLLVPFQARAAEQRAIFGLVVDQVRKGDVLAVIRPGDVLVEVADLEAAGLKHLAGKRETIAGRVYVSLASLAPAVKYELDEKAVAIKLTVEPAYLAGTLVQVSAAHPPPNLIYSREPSAFINYAVSLADNSQVDTFGEGGLSLFGNTLLDSTLTRGSDGVFQRGFTNLTIDDPRDTRQLIFGDRFVVSRDLLGGAAAVGGVTLSRNFALDPYFIVAPQGSFMGAATTPSTLFVYVNGQLVRKQDLPPGVFNVQNIPYFAGSGTEQIVVRDAFGREQEFTSSYYLNPQALAPGLFQYDVTVGPEKKLSGSWQYGSLIFDADARYGLTQWLTPGVRFESGRNVLNGGAPFTLATPLGGLTLSAAFSEAKSTGLSTLAGLVSTPRAAVGTHPSNVTGYAGAALFTYYVRRLTISGQLLYKSAHYANLSLTPDQDRLLVQALVSGSYAAAEGFTISPELEHDQDRDFGTSDSLGIGFDYRLARDLVLFGGARYSRQSAAPPSLSLTIGVGYTLGPSTVANASYQQVEGGARGQRGGTYTFQLAQATPIGKGYGYQLGVEHGPGINQQTAELDDHGDHGYYQLDLTRSTMTTSNFTFSGSLVALGGRLLAGPPVQGSYALIRVPELPGVTGYLYHQPIGRTDARGDLLVTQLVTSYFGNQFSINQRDIPISYRVDATDELAAPPDRGGAVVAFPVRPIRSFFGKLLVQLAGRPVVPSYGTLTMTAEHKDYVSPIGKDGAFFFDSPPAGRFPAKIDFSGGTCSFRVEIARTKQPFVKMGTLHCAM